MKEVNSYKDACLVLEPSYCISKDLEGEMFLKFRYSLALPPIKTFL